MARPILFLVVIYCIVSSLVSCRTAYQAGYGQSGGSGGGTTSAAPKFLPGLHMAAHNKKATTANIVEINRSFGRAASEPVQSSPTTSKGKHRAAKKTQRKPTPTVIVKRYPGETHDTAMVVSTPKQDNNQPTEPATDETTETDQTVIEETTPAIDDEVDTLVNRYAALMSVDPKKLRNYPLLIFIDEWYGTPYKYGGMDNNGIDCSAFSQKLYDEIYGIDLLRTVRMQRKTSKHIKSFADANLGDLIFFRIRRLRVSHVGVYLANGYFVHASRSHGVVISNVNNKYRHRRFAGCGRMRDDKPFAESDFMP